MNLIILFFLIITVISLDCYTDGKTTFDQLTDECKSNSLNNHYIIQNDFTFGSSTDFGQVTFQNNVILQSSQQDSWHGSSQIIYDTNSHVTFKGLWHSEDKSYIKENATIENDGMLSIKRELCFDPSHFRLNYPPIVFWKSTCIHLYAETDNQNFFISMNGETNECFDIFSLNSIDNLLNPDGGNKISEVRITGNEIPKVLIDTNNVEKGTLYKISNDKLLRFCPVNIPLNLDVTCEMIKEDYVTSYSTSTGKEGYSFSYPHCPCNDGTTNCYLHTSLEKININNNDLSQTTMKVDKDLTITQIQQFKSIEINDDVKLKVTMDNSKSHLFKFKSFDLSITSKESTKEVTIYYHSTSNIIDVSGDNQIIFVQKQNTNEILKIKSENTVEFDTILDNTIIMIDALSYSLPQTNLKRASIGKNITIISVNQTKGIDNCQIYSNSNSDNFICYSCDQNYYLSNNQCLEITANCKIISKSNGCILCESGYILDISTNQCIQHEICKEGNTTYCNKCKDNYYLENGECKEIQNCLLIDKNKCVKCSYGYKLTNKMICEQQEENNKCYYEKDNCISCYDDSYTLDIQNNQCILKETNDKNSINSKNENIYCLENEYIEDNTCRQCSSKSSFYCTRSQQYNCSSSFYFDNNKCYSTSCSSNYIKDQNGKCIQQSNVYDNCQSIVNSYCIECNMQYTFGSNEKCVSEKLSNCLEQKIHGCIRCKDGYYLDITDNKCYQCSENCLTCFNQSTYCTSCSGNKFVNEENKCEENKELEGKCKTMMITGKGCAICLDGYYKKEGFDCLKCQPKCKTCNNGEKCLSCADDHFVNIEMQCENKTSITHCIGNITTTKGCEQCEIGYYLYHKKCYQCHENCYTCDNGDTCTSCLNDQILIDGKCQPMSMVSNCLKVDDGKCTECSFWYQPSEDGTKCNEHAVWWVILLGLIGCGIILLLIALLISWLLKYIIQIKNATDGYTILNMEETNMEMEELTEEITANRSTMILNNGQQIKVCEEWKETLFIGNNTKKIKKIQIVMTEPPTKYEISIKPECAILKRGQMSEFEITVKPLCTCKIEDSLTIVSTSLKDQTESIPLIMYFSFETEISTRIDPDELTFQRQLGEGCFGIVYLGIFKGNLVAIKKMKTMPEEFNVEGEFEKEVAMLDKFRCDYIVHFYGAVFFHDNICMVTEFAQHGGLQDLMNKRISDPIEEELMIKMLLDAARGLQYLHQNGILHRDIKPENFLVVSLEKDVHVNCKLGDFGSSRNYNLLMTNMTFTKEVGTPVYMAPEMLHHQKYKEPADIYSFSITMLEVMICDEAFPPKEYKFSWDIANAVSQGKRPTRIERVTNQQMKSLIENTWNQHPSDRLEIDAIVEQLENEYNKHTLLRFVSNESK